MAAGMSSFRSAGERAPDHQTLDVAGALVDLADAHVAIDALDREVGHISIAAMDLDRVRAHALGHFRREKLRHRGLLEARQARVSQARRMPGELPGGFDLGSHVGEPKTDRLMLDDRLAEAFPLSRIR